MDGSVVALGDSYTIPDILMIGLRDIIDEHNEVYRVALGRADLTPDEEATYKPLFDAIDTALKRSRFVNDIRFEVGDTVVLFDTAYISRRVYSFGRFYDIEASFTEAKQYNKGSLNGKVKSKKIQ